MLRQYRRVNPPPRQIRNDKYPVDRFMVISYGYGINYGLYSFLILCVWGLGGFKKQTERDPTYGDYTCPVQMKAWFAFYIFFCPLALVISCVIA